MSTQGISRCLTKAFLFSLLFLFVLISTSLGGQFSLFGSQSYVWRETRITTLCSVVPPKEVCVLILGTCDYVRGHDQEGFQAALWQTWRCGDGPGLPACVPASGRGIRKCERRQHEKDSVEMEEGRGCLLRKSLWPPEVGKAEKRILP